MRIFDFRSFLALELDCLCFWPCFVGLAGRRVRTRYSKAGRPTGKWYMDTSVRALSRPIFPCTQRYRTGDSVVRPEHLEYSSCTVSSGRRCLKEFREDSSQEIIGHQGIDHAMPVPYRVISCQIRIRC